MFNHVLITCMGNICRSPMAEYLLQARVPELTVFSAGIDAVVGKPAERAAEKLMMDRGIDITEHCAQQLNSLLLSKADLVLAMEPKHMDIIHQMYPASRGKVFLLGKWINNQAVPDPYRRGDDAFIKSFKLIEAGIAGWQDKVWRTENVEQRYSYC